MVDEFVTLTCGPPGASGSFGAIIAHLSTSLKRVATEVVNLPAQSADKITLYGPFLGRSILDLAFTTFIGRLDPARLLVLREMQMHIPMGDAKLLGERCQTAIQWSGSEESGEVGAVAAEEEEGLKKGTEAKLEECAENGAEVYAKA